MNIEENDIITLNDGHDYSVVKIIGIDLKKIYFLADINDLSIQRFMYVKTDNKLVEIKDEKMINRLKEIITENPDEIIKKIDEVINIIDQLN